MKGARPSRWWRAARMTGPWREAGGWRGLAGSTRTRGRGEAIWTGAAARGSLFCSSWNGREPRGRNQSSPASAKTPCSRPRQHSCVLHPACLERKLCMSAEIRSPARELFGKSERARDGAWAKRDHQMLIELSSCKERVVERGGQHRATLFPLRLREWEGTKSANGSKNAPMFDNVG